MSKRESPRACPRCGSCAVIKVKGHRTKNCKNGTMHICQRCAHESPKPFPKVGNSKFMSRDAVRPEGSHKGMASGCTMVRPIGNKYS